MNSEKIVVIDAVRKRDGCTYTYYTKTDDEVGTVDELKYFRVMPIDGPKKIFYRSKKCWETYHK